MRPEGAGLGKALRQAMGHEEIPSELLLKTSESSLLMNPMRQRLFRALCKHPCSNLRSLARLSKVSAPTVEWHLERMVGRGLVRSSSYKNRLLFCPAEMVREGEVEPLHVLNSRSALRIMRAILESPGLIQAELYRSVGTYQQAILLPCQELEAAGFIAVQAGKRTRYEPTSQVRDMSLLFDERSKGFLEWLLAKLEEDGVRPRVKGRAFGRVTLQLQVGAKRKSMRLNTIPEPLIQLARAVGVPPTK